MSKCIRYLIFTLFLVFTGKSYSQAVDNPELPNLSPQSPNAFEFTKYGEVNVNESTGTINLGIPLYTYRAGEIEIPLTLNYSGNGVKVAQDATWVGINWNFTPGGVITRQVRDLPDEITASNDKEYLSISEINALPYSYVWNNFNTGSWYSTLYNIGNATGIDSEVDIFNYNFLGYSGSFYLEEDPIVDQSIPSFLKVYEGRLIKYDKELKIELHVTSLTANKNTIIITTPDGAIYSFGGPNASESSKTVTNAGAGSSVGIDFVQNAFYLYQVSTFNGDSVSFNYEQKNNISSIAFLIDKQETLKNGVSCEPNCSTPSASTPYVKRDVNLHVQSAVFLSSITSSFSNISIEFDSSTLQNSYGQYRKKRLTKIYVKDENDIILKEFRLGYDTMSGANMDEKKYFLDNVSFYDKNSTNEVYEYIMEYDDPASLPSRTSYARDFNGYYNGVSTNGNMTTGSLLPTPSTTFTGFSNFSDRGPSLSYMKKGSLKKIFYPTGGYSSFTYGIPSGTDFPSLRIEKIISDTGTSGDASIIKKYYYKDRIGVSNNSSDTYTNLSQPKFEYTNKVRVLLGGLLYETHEYKYLSASALNNVYGNDSGRILYPYVTVSYGGDDFEQGGKESTFKVNYAGTPIDYLYGDLINSLYATNDITLKNSTLEQERYFAGISTVPIKEVIYDYAPVQEVIDKISNIKVVRKTSGFGPRQIEDFQFGNYDIASNQFMLRKKTTKDYVGTGTSNIESVETYDYADYTGLPSAVTSKTSEGVDIKTEYYYPMQTLTETESMSTGDINSLQTALQELESAHKISQPYLVKRYKDDILESTQLTMFSDNNSSWPNNFPSEIRTARVDNSGDLNSYENRITFLDYTTKGRPLEVSLANGPITKYEYNTNGQVTLKVENYDSNDVNNNDPVNPSCEFQEKYPNALVTVYEYDPDNGNLIGIKDPRCRITIFEYDDFNRLKLVKDDEGNVVSYNKYHYLGH